MDTVIVKKVIHGGMGIGVTDTGMTVLLETVLPEERVCYSIVDQKKNHLRGKVTDILTANQERVTPPCIYFEDCGGCDFMHASYPLQLEIKQVILKDLLERTPLKTLAKHAEKVQHPLPSPDQFGYRQRIRLQTDEQGRLGYRKRKSHHIVRIKECIIAHPLINQALQTFVQLRPPSRLLEQVKEIEFHLDPGIEKIRLLLHLRRKPRASDRKEAIHMMNVQEMFSSITFAGEGFATEHISLGSEAKPLLSLQLGTPSPFYTTLNLQWEVGGFCQVNLKQNEKMVNACLEFLHLKPTDTVLDLYCGMGNFSLPMASLCQEVLGIEGQRSSIRSAEKNSIANNIENVHFKKQDIATACDELIASGQTFSHTILDPPRAGAPGLAPRIAQLTTKSIIYISCDPATLCRDLIDFEENGFLITHIQPIDMFPQTHHLETMVVLEKN